MTAPKLLSTRIPFAGFYESIWSEEIDRAELDLLGGEVADKRALDPGFVPPTPPCPYTLDLFPRSAT